MELGRTRSRIADAFFVVVTLSIVLPATLSAQLGSTFDLEDRQAAVGRVPIGKIIRLRLSDGGRAAGPVRRWNSLAVVLGPYMGYAAQDTFVSIRAIDTLWLRGNAKRRGAIYGGISGLSLGLVIGVTSGSLCPRAGWIRPCTQGALRSGAVGLLAGGLIGAVVGSGTPEWQRLHPRGRSVFATPSTGRQVTLEARDASTEPDARALVLLRARPGALVNLRFSSGPDLEGFVARVGFRRVMIAPIAGANAPEGPLALESIEGIWERGTAARTGSVIGGLFAFGAGAYVGSQSTSCGPSSDCTTTMLADGLLAGLAGWALGGRIGHLVPRWHRRY